MEVEYRYIPGYRGIHEAGSDGSINSRIRHNNLVVGDFTIVPF